MTTFFQNMRIGTRLGLSFASVITLICVLTTFTLLQLRKVEGLQHESATSQQERTSLTQEWRTGIAVSAQRALAIGVSSDPSVAEFFKGPMAEQSARTNALQKRVVEIEVSPGGIALLAELADVRSRYLKQREAMMGAKSGEDPAKAMREMAAFKPLLTEYLAAADKLVKYEEHVADLNDVALQAALSATRTAALAVTAACVILASLLGWLLTRSIVTPLGEAQRTAERIASGNLSIDPVVGGRDETGQLMTSLAAMQTSLRSLVGGIRQSVDGIGTASKEVASGNQDLSQRTEQAAASLEETAGAMEQLASTIRSTADSAKQANQLAATASEVASRGGVAVVEVVTTMDGINVASKRIAEITGVIDAIAFQTNILALNAAVEAARAGEQGRGFAVVASEVRALAQRSAEAAKEIKSLIGASVDKIETGSRQVSDAGKTMTDIVASVRRVSDIINEISAATSEQAIGVNEVNKAVTQLDQATQQNAALVEQSAAAAESLKDQASSLAGSVERFRLA